MNKLVMETLMTKPQCSLCLTDCTENAIEEMFHSKIEEAINFVFKFTLAYTTHQNKRKFCSTCYNCVTEFYHYSKTVMGNQEFIKSMASVRNEEPTKQEVDTKDGGLLSFHCEKTCNIASAVSNTVDPCETGGRLDNTTNSIKLSIDKVKPAEQMKECAFSCTECLESFSIELLLLKHLDSRINCKDCGQLFCDRKYLQGHVKKVHKHNRVMCDKCGITVHKCNLKYHIRAKHSFDPVVPLQCNICLKGFNNSDTLRSHKRSIHDEAGLVFPCNVCFKSFSTSRSLRVHKVRVHSEDKFSCSICHKQFKFQMNLKEHMAAHTGVTLYECDICGHKFNSNANMYAHRKHKHPSEWIERNKGRTVISRCKDTHSSQ